MREDTPPPVWNVGGIVPPNCTGYSFVLGPGVVHVRKDGSGYIVVDESVFLLEDDRCEGEHGPEGSVHWIVRLGATEMVALRDFLNGAPSSLSMGSQALLDVAAERRRQLEVEGWDPTHDDEHTDCSIALAAGSYCESAARPKILARKPGGAFAIPKLWPQSWSRDWWKPKSPREDLVRAGALILAEIERLDRAALLTTTEEHS